MRRKLTQIRNMLYTVSKFFTDNTSIFTTHSALSEEIGLFQDMVVSIDNKVVESGGITTGRMEEKEAARADLQDNFAEPYAANLYAFGKKTGNNIIMAQCDYKEYQLDNMSDVELADTCEALHAVAVANVASLTNYNITEERNTLFASEINTFKSKFIGRKLSVKELKTLNEEIEDDIRAATRKLRDDLDRLMVNIRNDHPTEYSEYVHAREIVDIGVHTPAPEPAEPPAQ